MYLHKKLLKMPLPQMLKGTKLPPAVKSSRRKHLAKEQCSNTWPQFTARRSHWWSSARIDTEIGDIQLSALRQQLDGPLLNYLKEEMNRKAIKFAD